MSKRAKLVAYMLFWAVTYTLLGVLLLGPLPSALGYLGTGAMGAGLGWFIWMLFVQIGTGRKN